MISQATFHDWASDGDETVGLHALHAWMFERSAWERSPVSGLSALSLVHQIEGLQVEPRLADPARQTVQVPA